ncbi:MAG TPA: response regulator [Geobacter sp.]|nr:response regulator [Geobacter sp.]
MGNKLLLADDSITIQKVVAIIFANEEFELTVVDNGNAALEKAREIQPDVMLVDALMPGKTGYEVCAEIRRDPRLGSVPILLLIGAFEPLDEQKARDCGADATISKPFESQQLIDRVKEMLELGASRVSAPPAVSAPPIAPPPLESAAEELWGDLSSFDTMPPVAPAAPVNAESAWADLTETPFAEPEPVLAAAAQPVPSAPVQAAAAAPVQEELVEASLEDDLWGAFELEDEPAAPATPATSPAQLFGVAEPEAQFEAEEFFSFDDEAEEIEETGPALDAQPVEEPSWTPPAEEFFSEEPQPVEAQEAEGFQLPEYEGFAFEPEAAAPVVPAAAAAEPAPPVEPVAAPELRAAAPAAPVAPAAEPPPSAAAAVASLSEDALAAAISRISREVIERIVWEVVPDLAEALIKEEIRKLKAGERG